MSFSVTLLFCISVVISFLLSGMEAGVFALSRLRIRHQMRSGNRRAQVLYSYLENPERFLWTILLGNTLANLVIVAMGVMLVYMSLGYSRLLVVITLLGGLSLFYAFCELLPKTLFRLYPNRLCMYVAPSFRLIYLLMSPLVSIVTFLADSTLGVTGGKKFTGRLFGNREELRRVMQESAQGLTSDERLIINRVMDLQNLTLRQIAIPMEKVVSVSVETRVSEILNLYRERGFSRMPAWRNEAGRRRIAGLVTLNSIIFQSQLEESKTAGDFLKPALFLDQEMRLEVALRQFQRKGQRLAIVLDHQGKEWGIVSLQDILKVIFGEVSL